MYNFLTASNSIIINYFKQKKIILSTNLSDINSIDEALLRPGRCFDIIETRHLSDQEAITLLKILKKTDKLLEKKYTIAEIFNSSYRRIKKSTGF
jgi:ATP-dependent 26S proteasome regulatory subunit